MKRVARGFADAITSDFAIAVFFGANVAWALDGSVFNGGVAAFMVAIFALDRTTPSMRPPTTVRINVDGRKIWPTSDKDGGKA
jgi:hypothetical protein